MFKHTPAPNPTTESEAKPAAPVATEPATRELVEKNLKWSQIIYEQNRKINRKLSWILFAGWLRFLLIAVPLLLAFWFLPPLIRQLGASYGNFFKDLESGQVSPESVRQFMKFIPQTK